MRLIEQLYQILKMRPDLDLEERLVLKTAIRWLDQRDYWALAEQNESYEWELIPRASASRGTSLSGWDTTTSER
jgi:hypothetical protein